MAYVYILQDEITKRYYVGSCLELSKRVARHQKHRGGQTTRYGVWNLVCYTECVSIVEARILEKLVKSYKGGNAFKKIINGNEKERWVSWLKPPHC